MKKTSIFAILIICAFNCNAQLDYGCYIRHEQLGQYDAQYQFFYSEGMFTYCTDRYNDLTGGVCISGLFNIDGDSVTFYNLSIEVPVLSDLTRISLEELGEERILSGSSAEMRRRPTSSNFWSLTSSTKDHSRKTIKLDPAKRFSASFFRHEKDEYIEIDGERFYDDPGPEDMGWDDWSED